MPCQETRRLGRNQARLRTGQHGLRLLKRQADLLKGDQTVSGLGEKGLNMTLVKQTGLPVEEFSKLQKAVSNLRDNLIKAAGSD